MTKGLIKNILALGAVVLFFAAVALAAKGKTVEICTDAVLPDGQVLKAGKYLVVMGEGEKQVEFLKGSKMVAKHPCQCLGHQEVNRHTETRFVEGPEKKQRLTEIRFAGKRCVLNLDVKQGM